MVDFGTYPPKPNSEGWNALLAHGLEKDAEKIVRKNGANSECINGSTGKLDYGPLADQSTVIQWALSHLTTDRDYIEKVLLKGKFDEIKTTLLQPDFSIIEIRGKLKAHADLVGPLIKGDKVDPLNGNRDQWIIGQGELDGNVSVRGVSDATLIELGCLRYHIHGLTLNNSPQDAIHIKKPGTGSAAGIINEIGGTGHRRHGVFLEWGGDSIVGNIGLLGSGSDNTGHGLYVYCHGGSLFGNIHMSNFLNDFVFERGNNVDWGLGARCKNLYADTPHENALWLKTSGYSDCMNIEIDGFWVLGNSNKEDADYAYIRLSGSGGKYVRNNSIKGIRIAYVHDGTHPRYGIIEEGTVANNLIEDAHIYNFTVALSNVNPLNSKVRRIYDGKNNKWSEDVLSAKNIVTGGSTIPHGLCFIPNRIQPLGNADARIWRHQVADATNIYLTSSANITADIAVGRD